MDKAQIERYNSRIFKILSVFLNLRPDYITPEMIREITSGEREGEEYAYAALVASACGLDIYGNAHDREFFAEYFVPAFRRADPEPYINDPYYRKVRFPSGECGDWKFEKRVCRAYEAFVYNDPTITPSGKIVPQIAYFPTDYEYPAVTEGGREWMTLMPNEINTTLPAVERAHGKVLTFGLGLGYFAYRAALKDEVESVTVVELSGDITNLFKTYVLPQLEVADKINIVCADAFSFAENEMEKGGYDFVFADVWHDPSDGTEAYLKLKKYEDKLPRAEFVYWIEDTLKLYI